VVYELAGDLTRHYVDVDRSVVADRSRLAHRERGRNAQSLRSLTATCDGDVNRT